MLSNSVPCVFFFLSAIILCLKIVNCFPSDYSPEPFLELDIQDPRAEFSKSVQKTYQHDINVRKPSVILQPLIGPHHVVGSFPIAGYPRVIGRQVLGPTGVLVGQQALGPTAVLPEVLVSPQTIVGQPVGAVSPVVTLGSVVLPHEEENHHLYREESENLSRKPIVGAGGVISPVALLEKDNSERTYRRHNVKKPVATGGAVGPLLAV